MIRERRIRAKGNNRKRPALVKRINEKRKEKRRGDKCPVQFGNLWLANYNSPVIWRGAEFTAGTRSFKRRKVCEEFEVNARPGPATEVFWWHSSQ